MSEIQSAKTDLLLHVPERGYCRGRLVADLTASDETGGYRFLVVRPEHSPPLVVQVEYYDLGRYPRLRASAWLVPPACEPIEARLPEATTPARARALLGAGTGGAWLIFDEYEDLGLDPDPDDWPSVTWRPASMEDVPDGLWPAAFRASGAWAGGHHIDLDAADFEVLAASTAEGGYEHNGVDVLGWEAVRIVISVRLGGADALLVAEVRAAEGQDFGELVAQDHVTLRIVPHTGPAEAERIALAHDPGMALRPDFLPPRPTSAETNTTPER